VLDPGADASFEGLDGLVGAAAGHLVRDQAEPAFFLADLVAAAER
jgi:hypothetical protein